MFKDRQWKCNGRECDLETRLESAAADRDGMHEPRNDDPLRALRARTRALFNVVVKTRPENLPALKADVDFGFPKFWQRFRPGWEALQARQFAGLTVIEKWHIWASC